MNKLVYILGSSYSGSTLLGILLGQHRQCFNAGEIKALGRRDADAESCSCGEPLASCPFWSDLRQLSVDTLTRPGLREWLAVALAMLRKTAPASATESPETLLIKGIADRAFGTGQSGTVVDVSKSLWRLHRLREFNSLEIRVVWIRKSLPASISSLRKRGRGYWTAMLQAVITDWANRMYLTRQNIEYIETWYEELATSTDANIADLWASLGLDTPTSNVRKDASEMHLATGNEGTKLKVNTHGTIKVNLDRAWKTRLSQRQQRIACAAARRRGDPIDVYGLVCSESNS